MQVDQGEQDVHRRPRSAAAVVAAAATAVAAATDAAAALAAAAIAATVAAASLTTAAAAEAISQAHTGSRAAAEASRYSAATTGEVPVLRLRGQGQLPGGGLRVDQGDQEVHRPSRGAAAVLAAAVAAVIRLLP